MKYYLIILFFFYGVNISFGTAQVPDYIIVDNDTLKIHSNPLESYFIKHPLPTNLITSMSTANWRGYIAFFKFINNRLVVDNIYREDFQDPNKNKYEERLVSIYNDVFGTNKNFDCGFYTGILTCPYGKLINYVHMGYGSIYENYLLYEISNGVLINSKDFKGEEYNKYKLAYFKYYKTTDEYKLRFKEFKEMTMDNNRSFEKVFEENKKSKKGNKYLKLKEDEYKADKMTESFMYYFLNDYITTIEIPKIK